MTAPGGTKWLTFKSLDLDESEEDVKTGAGRLGGLILYNAHATDMRYVKVYKTNTVTVGTTVPNMTIPVKALAEPMLIDFGDGLVCANGITLAATTAAADADTGAPAAGDVIVGAWYI